jgi:hypothetical protein
VSCVCKTANLGFACKIESSIGGSIFVFGLLFGDVNIEADATSFLSALRPLCISQPPQFQEFSSKQFY